MSMDIGLKRGDSLQLQGFFTAMGQDGAAIRIDLTGGVMRAQLRYLRGALVSELEVALIDGQNGAFILRAEAEETRKWPITTLICDTQIEFASGQVMSTPSFRIVVEEDVTHG